MKLSIQKYCERRLAELDWIDETRKQELAKLTAYIRYKESDPIHLVFIDNDNARGSLFAQVWAKVAARYFGLEHVETYSAGNNATEIAGNFVYTLLSLQFDLFVEGDEVNSRHFFVFDNRKNACICFAKPIDHYSIPLENFGTIDTNPTRMNIILAGSELQVHFPYTDPQTSDGTSEAQQNYRQFSNEIAREMLYLFSRLKK